MGDVGPPRAVALGDLDAVAEHLRLATRPRARRSARPRARPRCGARCGRGPRTVHRDLAEDGRDLALDRLGEQVEPRARVVGLAEQAAEDELLGEDRGGLGDRQRRALVEDPLLAGQVLVDPVAELVGEGRHVAAAVGPVEHHVGVDRGHGRGAEGAAALALGRGGTSIQRSSTKRSAISRIRGETESKVSRTMLAALVPLDLARRRRRRRPSGRSRRAARSRAASPSSGTSAGPARSGP